MKAIMSKEDVNWGLTGFFLRKGWILANLLKELAQPDWVLLDNINYLTTPRYKLFNWGRVTVIGTLLAAKKLLVDIESI